MTKMLLLFVVLLFATTSGQDECPDMCVCQDTHVTCSGLNQVPSSLPIHTTHLDLNHNRIHTLDIGKVASLYQLEHLNLSYNRLQVIEPLSLSNCTLLVSIDLSHNHLVDLPTDLVRGLTQLRHLNLSHNTLRFDKPFYQNDIECHLKSLDLSHNDMRDLKDNVFHLFSTVENFILSNNRLKQLRYEHLSTFVDSLLDWFSTSIFLENNQDSLHIDSRFLENPAWKVFSLRNSNVRNVSFLKTLRAQTIDLSDNPLNMDSFRFNDFTANMCEHLRVRNTSLRMLKNYPFGNFKKLRILDLSHNQLRVLDEQLSKNMTSLEHLDVSNNRLLSHISINFGAGSKSLKSINLSRCALQHIDAQPFSHLTFLQRLDLSHNRLETLQGDLQRVFSTLTHLNISHNNFHCNCKMKWIQQWLASTSRKTQLYDQDSPMCKSPVPSLLSSGNYLCWAPRIIPGPRSMKVSEGEDMEIKCEVDADPIATIDIFHQPSGVHNIKSSSSMLARTRRTEIVTLKKVEPESQGWYSCEASNQLGKAKYEWFLTVSRVLRADTTTKPAKNNRVLPNFDLDVELFPENEKITTTTTAATTATTITKTTAKVTYRKTTPTTMKYTYRRKSSKAAYATFPSRVPTSKQYSTSTKKLHHWHSTHAPLETSTSNRAVVSMGTSALLHPSTETPSNLTNLSAGGSMSKSETRLAILLACGVTIVLLLLLIAVCIVLFLRRRRKRMMYLLEKRSTLLRPYPKSGSYDRRARSNGGMINTPATQDSLHRPQNGFNMLQAKEKGTL